MVQKGILEQTGQPVEMEATEVQDSLTGATAHEIWISEGNVVKLTLLLP
jgi:hypothetical protein